MQGYSSQFRLCDWQSTQSSQRHCSCAAQSLVTLKLSQQPPRHHTRVLVESPRSDVLLPRLLGYTVVQQILPCKTVALVFSETVPCKSRMDTITSSLRPRGPRRAPYRGFRAFYITILIISALAIFSLVADQAARYRHGIHYGVAQRRALAELDPLRKVKRDEEVRNDLT